MRRLPVILLCCPLPAAAQAAAAPGPGAGSAAIAQVSLSLLVVLGVVVALAWLAKRLKFVPQAKAGSIRILADLPLGPRERVVLLEVGDRQALVGVSGAGVSSLALLDAEIRLPEPSAPGDPSPLADRFRSLLERGGRQ